MPAGRNERADTGRAGEDLASLYLQRQGCSILARNWRGGRGEVDIVAECPASSPSGARELAFVEVRTRHGRSGLAEESISQRKASSMVAAAYAYMAAHGLDSDIIPWRIDIVALAISGGDAASVNWIRGALDEGALGGQ